MDAIRLMTDPSTPRRLAGVVHARGGLRKRQARQAVWRARYSWSPVASDRGGVDPRNAVADAVVIEQEARLKVVGAVDDKIAAIEQRNVCGC